MISEEFLVYFMWSFIVVCLGASVGIWTVRGVKERRSEREGFVADLRDRQAAARNSKQRPYDWGKEKNV